MKKGTLLFMALFMLFTFRCDDEEGDDLFDAETLLLMQELGLLDDLFGTGRGSPGFQCGTEVHSSHSHLAAANVEGELLVAFEETATSLQIQSALSPVAARMPATATAPDAASRTFHKVELSGSESLSAAMERLQNQPGVAHVQPNHVRYPMNAYEPNDSWFISGNTLWGLDNDGSDVAIDGGETVSSTAGIDIRAVNAWQFQHENGVSGGAGSCEDVVVAVLDSGMQHDHDELATNLWGQAGNFSCKDPQGNSITCAEGGYNFHDDQQNQNVADSHGTHVAGTIGMQGNNSDIGVGVCWNVQLMLVQVLGPMNGDILGTEAAIVNGIDFARQNGAHIINMSLGGPGGEDGDLTYQAIERARDAGILVVTAAGNSGYNNDQYSSFPANYNVANIVSVGAIDPNGNLTDFSQYGTQCVEIAAPGQTVWSAAYSDNISSTNETGYMNGTSMATPHIAGIAALMKQTNQSCGYADIRAVLLETAQNYSSLDGRIQNRRMGDAGAAVQAIASRQCN